MGKEGTAWLAAAPDGTVEWWAVGLGNRRSRETANAVAISPFLLAVRVARRFGNRRRARDEIMPRPPYSFPAWQRGGG
jgi:hypothetical protein